jgi:hypothetical protein
MIEIFKFLSSAVCGWFIKMAAVLCYERSSGQGLPIPAGDKKKGPDGF